MVAWVRFAGAVHRPFNMSITVCYRLFSLRYAVAAEQFDELHGTIKQLEQDIFHELSRLRSEVRADDSY